MDVALAREAAAHVGDDHADPLLGQADHRGDRAAHRERHLRRRPHREPAPDRIGSGEDAAGLERHAGHARVGEARGHHHRARARASAGWPLELVVTEARLSGQVSLTRGAPGARAAAGEVAAGSGAEVTVTRSMPSAAAYRSVSTTTASPSPTWRAREPGRAAAAYRLPPCVRAR